MDQNMDEQGTQTGSEEVGQSGGEYIQQQGEYTQQQSYQQGEYIQQQGEYTQQQSYQQGEYTQQPYQQYYQQEQNPYSQYQNNNYRENRQSTGLGFGLASMIMGIVSLILFCTCINIPIALAAIIFGIIYLSGQQESKVYGIVGIITAALSILCFFAMIALAWRPVQSYYQEIEDSIDMRLPNGIYDGDDIFDSDDIFDEDDFFEDYNPVRPQTDGKEGKAIWQRF